MDWKFNPDDYDPNGFSVIPEGEYRVRIEDAEETTSRNSGKPMIKLTLAVSGSNSKIWKYIVLDASSEETRKSTNNRLGRIFDSFGIEPGNMNLDAWKDRAGGAKIRHGKDDKGNTRAEIYYFMKRSEVEQLPAWRDENSASAEAHDFSIEDNPFSNDSDLNPDNLPF